MTSTDRHTKPGLGEHWLLECYGPLSRYDEHQLEKLMHQAATAGGATVLMCHTHRFPASKHHHRLSNTLREAHAGVTGVLMLAESHISVHTWPEHNYAAFDICMCSGSDPKAASEVIRQSCQETDIRMTRISRGMHASLGTPSGVRSEVGCVRSHSDLRES